MNLICPKCQAVIPLEDVNVSTDIVLCRRCSQTFSFAELSQDKGGAKVDVSRPPKGTWHKSQGNEFEVGCTTRSWGALFLVPFTLIWSGGSLGGIYGSQFYHHRFDLLQSLFGLPFLLGSLILVPFTLMAIVGKLSVRGSGDQGSVFMGIGPLGWNRRFRWNEIRSVRVALSTWKQNDQRRPLIELEAVKPIRFGSGLSEERRDFMVAVLRRKIVRR